MCGNCFAHSCPFAHRLSGVPRHEVKAKVLEMIRLNHVSMGPSGMELASRRPGAQGLQPTQQSHGHRAGTGLHTLQRQAPHGGAKRPRQPVAVAPVKAASAQSASQVAAISSALLRACEVPAAQAPSVERGGVSMSPEQAQVWDLVTSGSSVFFTGSAGTGKSFLLRHCVEALRDKYGAPEAVHVTAATGIAACALGGTTFHSFAGIGLGKGPVRALVRKVTESPASVARWRSARCLIIDEVSMLDGRLLEKAEEVARAVRGSSAPFGGLQVVLTGDFFQLPPVGLQSGAAGAAAGGGPIFAFQAACWEDMVPHKVVLRTVYRQSDPALLRVLNAVRVGHVDAGVMRTLSRAGADVKRGVAGLTPTRLFARNRDVDRINAEQLRKCEGEVVRYEAQDTGDERHMRALAANSSAPTLLELKPGAQVILLKNLDATAGLVNGARGVVVDFVTNEEGGWPTRLPRVRFAPPGAGPGDEERSVMSTVQVGSWNIEQGGHPVAVRTQVPLKLAYALSIHKAQGMTIDFLYVAVAGVFEFGQAYVALSRGVSLPRMRVSGFSQASVKVHPEVLAFYSTLVTASPAAEAVEGQVVDLVDSPDEQEVLGGGSPAASEGRVAQRRPRAFAAPCTLSSPRADAEEEPLACASGSGVKAPGLAAEVRQVLEGLTVDDLFG